ncbi:MAG: preprotein translocase subunit SecA, partial [Gemmataceae bacterium]|nr:preprotein translocase subunit SecA [Gemmataceae bacterium]
MTSNQIKTTWSDRWSTFSTGVMDGLNRFFLTVLGNENVRRVRKLGYVRPNVAGAQHTVVPGSLLDQINKLEPTYQAMSDADLAQTTVRLRAKLADGASLESLIPDAFAAVRESGKRSKGMRHYDVQMVGGMVLHQGGIAEMMTGEGKTLVATLPAYLNGLTGRGVHVITVNDYLARRDCEWMLPIYRGLGMEAAFIQSNMDPDLRRRAYDCDITYGTSSEFGFDYLRDNMKQARRGDNRYPPHLQQVMRMERDPRTDEFRLHYAIIDEVDNILIDEARTPLIISGQAFTNKERYDQANQVALKLTAEEKKLRNDILVNLRV